MPDVKLDSFEDYFTDFHPHICIYSWNGAGKTFFSGKTGLRTLLLDCGDAGVVTLRGVNKLKIVRIKSITHYLDAIDRANSLAAADKLDLLVVDTLTGLQSKAIREVKGKRNFEMNQRKWGQVSSRVIECLAETRGFPKDVIYHAQEKRKTTDDGDPVKLMPSITPGVREFLSGSCVDWVGRLYLEEGKRKMSFILSDDLEAKDRNDTFPKVIVNPNYMAIRKRIVESVHASK